MQEEQFYKLKIWASVLEEKTLQQARNTSTMPFIFPHVALMPDAHLGKGATVGSVIPTDGAIMPAAVGVDIGCGMMAVDTGVLAEELPENRRPLREAIEQAIPLSMGRYNTTLTDTAAGHAADLIEAADRASFFPDTISENWKLQLGTLGSGNHFIEVSADERGIVWLFLHSGSRGIGNKIAQKHIKIAHNLCKRWFIALPDPDLAYLVEGTDEFWAYIREMLWAQEFAKRNRQEMMTRVAECFTEWVSPKTTWEPHQMINCHHNYTTQETHFGQKVWLSRKGAIDAHEGVWGLIPGSMGTASYVVQGKGNPVALHSSPHGAGRNYSRTRARKEFSGDQLREAMKGIEYRDSDAFIDEIPQAYKDIESVMADSKDLVEVRHTLHQLVNVKGE